ncbi:MAG: dTMP kinase [Acidobacteriota bacterium]|nr:MAG: dTMP kinase [Acidobacteriota bacterium]
MSTQTGLFLTVEGIEGAGKSTQVRLLYEALRQAGHAVVSTREPGGGGGRVGEDLRDLLKDPDVWQRLELAEVYLYAAARAYHIESLLLPAMARGQVVLCDRYLDSTRAYQGFGRGRPRELIERLHQLPPLALRPARTLLLDLPAEIALERARERRDHENAGYDDADLAFFARVREGFLQLEREEPDRVRRIDAARARGAVHADVVAALRDLFPDLKPIAATR